MNEGEESGLAWCELNMDETGPKQGKFHFYNQYMKMIQHLIMS